MIAVLPPLPPLPPLPAARARVLDAIRRHIAVHGWPPTIREVQAAVGLAWALREVLDVLVDAPPYP